jgi:16S rRNA (uracil1498-N3)-methyltransferase
MHRFYLPPESCRGGELLLSGREAHHAAGVLRLRPGEAVSVLDGTGNEYSCTVARVAKRETALSIREKKTHPLPPFRVTLAQALPKGKIIESIIQKATELGVFAIVPLLTERVASRLNEQEAAHKAEQWRQVAVEAIKQCGQPWLPRIEAPMTPGEYLRRNDKFDLALVGSLQGDGRHPREQFAALPSVPATVRLWIGPEGDFTSAELDAIRQSGAKPITLGPLVLRVETAAIYTLSLVNYELTAASESPHKKTA